MRRCVYKYEIPFKEDSAVIMPADATLLKVGVVAHRLYLWAAVDLRRENRRYVFRIYRTGECMDRENSYLDTVFDGIYVWHIYLEGEYVVEECKSR